MSDRPNIVLITSDQQRFDTLAAAGNPAIFTPHLNWLLDSGIHFRRCYTDSPICMSARATIMTGRHGHTNGLTGNSPQPRPMAENPTLPGVLTRAGYQTRAVGKMHFNPGRAHYGFEHMELLGDYYRQMRREGGPNRPMDHGMGQNEMEPALSTIEESRSLTRWIVERSIHFLETRDDTRPFFLWTSFSKPHPPYDCDAKYWALYDKIDIPKPVYGDWSRRFEDVPAGFAVPTRMVNKVHRFSPQQLAASRRAYYACITQIDYNLGALFARLRELGHLENTWIIFTSDHGELLGDHWLAAKSIFLEGSGHVPMIIRPPASDWRPVPEQGTHCDSLVCLADILPTCLACAGVEPPADAAFDGRDMLNDYRTAASRDHVIAHAEQNLFGIIKGDFKYLFTAYDGAELLFNLKADPYEQHDLIRAGEQAQELETMRGLMVAHLKKHLPTAVRDGRPAARSDLKPGPQVNWPGFHSVEEPADVLH